MKKTVLFLAAIATSLVGVAEPISDGDIVPGEWNSNYRAAYQYALANNMPFVTIISKHPNQCHFCSLFHDKWTSDEFLDWARSRGIIMGAFYDNAPYEHDKSWCDWARGSYTGYPFVRIYWKKSDGTVVSDNFMGRNTNLGDNDGDGIKGSQEDFIARLEKSLVGWNSAPPYAGGTFADGSDAEGDRLEVEPSTTNVVLNLVRAENVASIAATNVLTVTYPSKLGLLGSAPSAVAAQEGSTTIYWESGATNKTISLPVDTSRLSDGAAIELVLSDAGGIVHGTSHIWFVDRKASASNPYWIGEKENLGFGEWTMDLDAATNLVAKAEGQANTIVLLSGSLWCPDCKNVEGNFLSATNSVGENAFESWAKSHNVALVMIDCPRFTNDTDYVRATLLSRKDVAGNGVSGLGYMTRKMISDELGAEIVERNRVLCSANTAFGGFHRPEDGNAYRTGVPYFVMLRKDGSVAARLTRWASSSTTAIDSENYAAFYNRFEEMLAIAAESGDHSDADEVENGYPGPGAKMFAANGGTVVGELCHADFRDVFKLDGVGGNALQKVVVIGDSSASVSVSFLSTNSLGVAETVGEVVTGKLSDGISLERTFTEARDYFVLVTGSSITAADWAIENPAADNFVRYSLSGDVILVPQEVKASARAPEGSSEVVMRLEKGTLYRIDGLNAGAVSDSLSVTNGVFYRALVSGDRELATAAAGGEVEYQIWNPGSVGFSAAAKSVKESAGTVEVQLARTGGTSGDVTVTVSLNEVKTDLEDSDGVKRYEPFEPVSVTWADGVSFATNVYVSLIDDARYDGPGVIVLDLVVTKDENGDTVVTNGVFELSVSEDDKAAPGVVTFVESGTVYCKESAGATLHAVRQAASDGVVSVTVSSSAGSLSSGVLEWGNHVSAPNAVTLSGLAAGKTATLSLAAGEGGVRVPSTGRSVKVTAVADSAPEFDDAASTFSLVRNVATSNLVEVNTQTFEDGSVLSFTKKSGTLPAGLKAAWNGASALIISGVPTKPGSYTAVYQVTAKTNGTSIPGLVTTLTFDIVDATAPGVDGGAPLNGSVAKSRTFRDVMIIDSAAKQLKGLLEVTVPANGRASAKYVCADGTIRMSSGCWSGIDLATGDLSAVLTGTTKAASGWSLALTAKVGGAVEFALSGPDGLVGNATVDGEIWSADHTAESYKGFYTVTLPIASMTAESEDLAPTGNGYITIDIQGKSALSTGRVKWAGMLPNGTAISGSTTLTEGVKAASLPIFITSSKDTISGVAAISPNADKLRTEYAQYLAVNGSAEVPLLSWSHMEPDGSEASFDAAMEVYGALYSESDDLESCCDEFFNGTTNMYLVVEATDAYSVVSVSSDSIALNKAENGLSATLKFSRKTGLVNGTLKLGGRSVAWNGVVLIGIGGCNACSAGAVDKSFPLVSGVMHYSEAMPYETQNAAGKIVSRRVTLKHGSKVKIDAVREFED